ncbi:type IV secretory system conjugative DNA transfer family protein [Nostoc sp. CHAB 5836]|uniref:type IV secretory system conjugative DNA transfer family protein n=1 Tax=Nostoc sp. CHAB 5836 TaxID=2780404 RepID=UPI001E542C67|nr:type IV secretory system conjugative DNA transfer family protein [Nostoc sp. CHAB 5836]MCC5619134.1 type IV secretory system conjugative DNA transfer family protein [Nostoc sp. CHAB 5836]
MSSNLHPSQLHQHLQMYVCAKWSFWGSLAVSCGLLFLGTTQKPESKPWILAASVGTLEVGRRHRQTAKLLQESLGDIDRASRLNFQGWARAKTQPTAQLAVTVGTVDVNWQPENLITDPVEYINKVQKHVALVGGTGDGKSTQAQYFSTRIGGRVVVYDVDSAKGDWGWVEQNDLIGDGGLPKVDKAMQEALDHLEKMRVYRKEVSKDIPQEFARFYIAEEFPVLADCSNASQWIRQHAKVGRKRKQFIMVLAQNDTAANFALEGDADILDTCFVRIRLGKKAQDYAKSTLKNPQLEQWLKAGGKKRFLVDAYPCELDLGLWQPNAMPAAGCAYATPETDGGGSEEVLVQPTAMNEFEQFILTWGQQHPDEVLKARILLQASRLFEGMQPDEVRIIFASMADRGLGEVEGNGAKLGWRWSK